MTKILSFILMMSFFVFGLSELKHTVKQSGGDFDKVNSAVAHIASSHADLVSLDVYATIEISGAWTVDDSVVVDISASILTDATHTLRVVTVGESRHNGAWSSTAYRHVTRNERNIALRISNVTFDGIQFSTKNTATAHYFFRSIGLNNLANFNVSNCIIKGHGNAAYAQTVRSVSTGTSPKFYMWNCIVYGFGTNSGSYFNTTSATDTVYISSSTFIWDQTYGIRREAGMVTCKNVYSGGITSSRSFYGTIDLTTCASSDTMGNIDSVVIDEINFLDTSSGTPSYLLPLGSELIGVGTNTSSDAAPMNFTTDIIGTTRTEPWDIGAFEYVSGCAAATITRHATITDTVGASAKRFGHAIENSFDSVKISTTLDSVAMLAYTTKDTIVYKPKKKAAASVITTTIYSCAGVSTNVCYDSLAFVGWAGTYTSPVVDTVGVAASHSPTNTIYADSFSFADLPSGASGNSTTGAISWTPSAIVAKTGVKIIGWYKSTKQDSTYDTISAVYPQIVVDSCSPDSGAVGSAMALYGYGFGASQGSSTISFGGSTPTITGWINTRINMTVPNIDTGWVDFIVTDGVTADTLLNGFKVIGSSVGPLSFSPYAGPTVKCRVGVTFLDSLKNAGGAWDSATVLPALPSGVALDKTTGVVTGIATTRSNSTVYHFYGWGGGIKADSTNLSIRFYKPEIINP